MATEPTPIATEPDDAAYAAALIVRERRDAQAGLWTLMVFFGLGTIGSVIIAVFVARLHQGLALPLVVVVGLIFIALMRRLFRFVRALGKLQQGWRDGRLSNGELAIDVARRRTAG